MLGDYQQALTSVDLFLAHNVPDAHFTHLRTMRQRAETSRIGSRNSMTAFTLGTPFFLNPWFRSIARLISPHSCVGAHPSLSVGSHARLPGDGAQTMTAEMRFKDNYFQLF